MHLLLKLYYAFYVVYKYIYVCVLIIGARLVRNIHYLKMLCYQVVKKIGPWDQNFFATFSHTEVTYSQFV